MHMFEAGKLFSWSNAQILPGHQQFTLDEVTEKSARPATPARPVDMLRRVVFGLPNPRHGDAGGSPGTFSSDRFGHVKRDSHGAIVHAQFVVQVLQVVFHRIP